MTSVAPGWYKDPAEPSTQRYWDGDAWVGPPLPLDTQPPPAGSTPATPAPPTLPRDGAIPPEWVLRRPMPAPMPHGRRLASPGARLVARVIDTTAVAGLALLANGWFIYRLIRELGPLLADASRGTQSVVTEQSASRISSLFYLIALVTAAVWLAYEVPATASTGQTPGKRALGIKVMRVENDERLGMGRALRRWTTIGLPTVLWPCCGIGLLLQFADCLFVVADQPMQQALHDRAARTVVVHVGRSKVTKSDGGST